MTNSPIGLNRRVFLQLGVASAALLAAAPARAAAQTLVIGTGGKGGVFYPFGVGLAALLSRVLPDTAATAEVTGGSVDNIKQLGAGTAQLGFSTADSALDGLRGEAAYAEVGPQPIAAAAVLYQSILHVVATRASGITSIAGIKGKRASVGSAGSSTESIADRVLTAAGLDPEADLGGREALGVAESAAALVAGTIDVFFWIGGVPTPAVADLVAEHGADIVFVETGGLATALDAIYSGVYQPAVLAAGAYAELTSDLPVLGVDNILLVPQDLDGALVGNILAAIFDNLPEVQALTPSAASLDAPSAARQTSVPFHPAAADFYSSRGALKK